MDPNTGFCVQQSQQRCHNITNLYVTEIELGTDGPIVGTQFCQTGFDQILWAAGQQYNAANHAQCIACNDSTRLCDTTPPTTLVGTCGNTPPHTPPAAPASTAPQYTCNLCANCTACSNGIQTCYSTCIVNTTKAVVSLAGHKHQE